MDLNWNSFIVDTTPHRSKVCKVFGLDHVGGTKQYQMFSNDTQSNRTDHK